MHTEKCTEVNGNSHCDEIFMTTDCIWYDYHLYKSSDWKKKWNHWIERPARSVGQRLRGLDKNSIWGIQNSNKRAYQLLKTLISEKQGSSTIVRDKSWKCLTEEIEVLSRWTECCSELYSMRFIATMQFWVRGYKTFSMLNSAEHELSNANTYQNIKKFSIFQAQIRLEC